LYRVYNRGMELTFLIFRLNKMLICSCYSMGHSFCFFEEVS
jgi:hypothetical protein